MISIRIPSSSQSSAPPFALTSASTTPDTRSPPLKWEHAGSSISSWDGLVDTPAPARCMTCAESTPCRSGVEACWNPGSGARTTSPCPLCPGSPSPETSLPAPVIGLRTSSSRKSKSVRKVPLSRRFAPDWASTSDGTWSTGSLCEPGSGRSAFTQAPESSREGDTYMHKRCSAAMTLGVILVLAGSSRLVAQDKSAFADKIQAILNRPEFAHATFGIEFYSLQSNQPLYRWNADKLMVPGSTTKLLTEATLLHFLGPEYQFHTR